MQSVLRCLWIWFCANSDTYKLLGWIDFTITLQNETWFPYIGRYTMYNLFAIFKPEFGLKHFLFILVFQNHVTSSTGLHLLHLTVQEKSFFFSFWNLSQWTEELNGAESFTLNFWPASPFLSFLTEPTPSLFLFQQHMSQDPAHTCNVLWNMRCNCCTNAASCRWRCRWQTAAGSDVDKGSHLR